MLIVFIKRLKDHMLSFEYWNGTLSGNRSSLRRRCSHDSTNFWCAQLLVRVFKKFDSWSLWNSVSTFCRNSATISTL